MVKCIISGCRGEQVNILPRGGGAAVNWRWWGWEDWGKIFLFAKYYTFYLNTIKSLHFRRSYQIYYQGRGEQVNKLPGEGGCRELEGVGNMGD